MLGKRPIPDKNGAAFSQQLQTFAEQWKIGPRLTLKNWIDLLNILYKMQITITLIINTSRWFKFARKAAMDRRLFSPPWRRGNKSLLCYHLPYLVKGRREELTIQVSPLWLAKNDVFLCFVLPPQGRIPSRGNDKHVIGGKFKNIDRIFVRINGRPESYRWMSSAVEETWETRKGGVKIWRREKAYSNKNYRIGKVSSRFIIDLLWLLVNRS